ncbi:general secretion pathway protein GspK [Telmatospirillum siberiense]|uniref:T2SS protein K first SAM-like domain-containing protein n=1 Tax=Telmatospirillum siberiense TaxID=382514 RepID=A0A2N3PMF0_9PROT|nr:type II secretion system protein GspK [Telmatospirillum siberiense]PKU21573.1 hypothetical protein CWS72_26030 [Telmatospirillum siberiense]
MKRRGEAGYALVMAMVAAGLFAYLSLLIVQANWGDDAVILARLDRARLDAAAAAGLAMALHGLGVEERGRRWAIDGTARQVRFDGVLLTIAVEDERSKVPINGANEDVLRRLLSAAGVRGRQLDSLAESILDWIDQDNIPRVYGAEADAYRAAGAALLPRNGRFRSREELLDVLGMTPQIFAGIAPSITLFFGEPGTFNATMATPLAVMAMQGASENPAEMAAWKKKLTDGTWTALENVAEVSLRGRPLTIRVEAALPDGTRLSRATIVQFTGSRTRPFRVRWYQ